MLLFHLDFIDVHFVSRYIRHNKPSFLRDDLRQVKPLEKKAKAKAEAKDEVKVKVERVALKGRAFRKGV
jgi:hypothetical protein